MNIMGSGNDDGLVPDSAFKDRCQFPDVVSSREKRTHEGVSCGTNHLESDTTNIKRKGDMLGRNPWHEKNNGESSVSRHVGSGKDVQDMKIEDTNSLDHGSNGGHIDVAENLCAADLMLCDSSKHDGVYNYSLNNISNAENTLSFLETGNKESTGLFYGWGGVGNFEDMDTMLRSCDSNFGLDCLDNEDDLCWFSSGQPNENTEATLTDSIKPDIMLENQRISMLQVEEFLNNDECNLATEDECRYTIVCGPAQGKSSDNVSGTSSQVEDILMLNEEANPWKKQIDHLHHLDGKGDVYSENRFTLQHSGITRETGDITQYYSPAAFQQPGVPYSHFNCEQRKDQISACESKSGISKPNPSSASNESYTSKQAQSVESLQGPTDDDQCRKGFEKRVSLQTQQDVPPSFAASTSKSNTAPIQKNGPENFNRKAAAELKTSNMLESSCASSVVEDNLLEATSFCQLRQVIEQLDVGTKLCIRDSLYRLAKSGEQRHNCMNPNGVNRLEKDPGSHLSTGETDKYVGFIDMETDTNPIDRSIAHLLFHRPSDSSLSSDNNVLSYKSHPVIPNPNSSPSLRIERQE
ncbi:unnamed protein product [Cochlearia groenlandica]